MASNLLSVDEIMDEIDRKIQEKSNQGKIDEMMLYNDGPVTNRRQ